MQARWAAAEPWGFGRLGTAEGPGVRGRAQPTSFSSLQLGALLSSQSLLHYHTSGSFACGSCGDLPVAACFTGTVLTGSVV